MPTKRDMQGELEKMRQELDENRRLMNQAALKAEEMMGLEDQHKALKQQMKAEQRKRRKKK